MGLFDRIFGNQKQQVLQNANFFKTFNAYMPAFTSWKGGVYESQLVRSAIDAIARNTAKLNVQIAGSARPMLQTKLKHGPNEWQTWYQFMYRLSTILMVQNTAFIVPVFDRYGEVTGVYPVLPSQCEIVESNGVVYLRYHFTTGQCGAIELKLCGIMTRHQYGDDFFGDSNGALVPTMELIHIQNQGIEEGIKSAATYRFMATMTNFSKAEDLAKERKRFNKENFEGEGAGGVIIFPNTYSNVKQVDSKPFVIAPEQMKQIETNVYNYFGVNEDVIQNKAYGDNWSAFYEGMIEPFAIQFSEVMSKMLFTMRERSSGSYVMATANRLQYMSNTDKLNVSSQMADRGIMNRDEVREIWNLPPLPNAEGQKYIIRGEYYEANTKLEESQEE